jgi:hypothetical protein
MIRPATRPMTEIETAPRWSSFATSLLFARGYSVGEVLVTSASACRTAT